jgi:hypothetical protein
LQAQVNALQARLASIAAEQTLAAKMETQHTEAVRREAAQMARSRNAD